MASLLVASLLVIILAGCWVGLRNFLILKGVFLDTHFCFVFFCFFYLFNFFLVGGGAGVCFSEFTQIYR